MMPVRAPLPSRPEGALLIEGYASVFGVEDRVGDIVRAGAFAQSLQSGAVPMLLQHRTGAMAGRWVRLIEDGRGLFVRGLVENTAALALIQRGLSGLSIGFRPLVWTQRPDGGRTLRKLALIEVSLVSEPMLDAARFVPIGPQS
ncbi:MAG: HK97 family phage prohead protease [Pseudomonadota bacterium]